MKKICFIIIIIIFIAYGTKAEEIAEKFAPILYFEKGEEVYPVNVEYFVSNSNLNESNKLILINPSIEDLAKYRNKSYYLDNRKGTINDHGIIDDYKKVEKFLGYTIYSHVFKKNGNTIVQYWMFYVFNKGYLNTHEGDWEMVQIILRNGEPIEAIYSQHIGGQKANWELVEKEGNHIKVYIAKGSHANYFRYYQGKLGLAHDIVGKNGKILYPKDYNLIVLNNQSWLYFKGRWGECATIENEIRGKNGPFGPLYRGDGKLWNGDAEFPLINKNLLYFEWFLYHFLEIYLIIFLISLTIILFSIYKKKRNLKPFIFNLNKGNALAIVGIAFTILALFYSWYDVFINIPSGDYKTPGIIKIISLDGLNGLQINLFEKNSGLVQLGALPIPFSIIIGTTILFFILGTIGINYKKARWKYIWMGIKLLIPIVLIIVAISYIKVFLFVHENLSAGEEAGEIINAISSNPITGEKILYLEKVGKVYLKWGIGYGGLFLFFSSILLIFSGIIINKQDKK